MQNLTPSTVQLILGVFVLAASVTASMGVQVFMRRNTKVDRAHEDAASLRLKEMEAQGGFRDDLMERNDLLEKRVDEIAQRWSDAAQGWSEERERWVVERTDLLHAIHATAEDLADIRQRLETLTINGEIQSRLVRAQGRLRATSARFGSAGGSGA